MSICDSCYFNTTPINVPPCEKCDGGYNYQNKALVEKTLETIKCKYCGEYHFKSTTKKGVCYNCQRVIKSYLIDSDVDKLIEEDIINLV